MPSFSSVVPDGMSAIDAMNRVCQSQPRCKARFGDLRTLFGRTADYDAVLMDGVGHYPHMTRPDDFNPLLLDAIGRILGDDVGSAGPSGSSGNSKLITCDNSSISIPRAAMSVATNTRVD